MDLIHKICEAEMGLIADVDQHLLLDESRRKRNVFHGDRILETDPT
jgi:hypothetical protein